MGTETTKTDVTSATNMPKPPVDNKPQQQGDMNHPSGKQAGDNDTSPAGKADATTK